MAVTPDNVQNPRPESRRIAREVSNAAALELVTENPELIVFSSQLVHGAVGLNAAEMIYLNYGLRAAKIPTILLSVLPHYPSVHHVDIPAEWISDTLHDIKVADALNAVKAVATGYLAHQNQAKAIAGAIHTISQLQSVPIIVDPTLGDTDVGFYTDPALVDAIRQWLLPLATGLVPNLFELSQLVGTPIEQLTDLTVIGDAARSLITDNLTWVVVTGIRFSSAHEINIVLVTHNSVQIFTHEYIDHRAKGVGDTYTALLLSELLVGNQIDTAIALSNTAILQRLRSTVES